MNNRWSMQSKSQPHDAMITTTQCMAVTRSNGSFAVTVLVDEEGIMPACSRGGESR